MNDSSKKRNEEMTIFVPRICPRASLRASLKASLRGLADDRIQRWLNDSTSREVFKESSKEYEFRGLIMKVSQDRDSEIVDLFQKGPNVVAIAVPRNRRVRPNLPVV
jgi:hypothetical protein